MLDIKPGRHVMYTCHYDKEACHVVHEIRR